jgi:hypothetical protein
MEPFSLSDVPLEGAGVDGREDDVNVHVLSEGVFCPRAAILALETGEDTGDEEPMLGPRLDAFVDYDEERFVEELRVTWRQFWCWLTWVAPAAFLAFGMWRLVSLFAGVASSLPLLYIVGWLWDILVKIVTLVRERTIFEAAPRQEPDLTSQQIRLVNWWSLRKAGFDCHKPPNSMRDPGQRLTGRPWRVLTKGTTQGIPVIRKHRGKHDWGPQHLVRAAAYCHLIETCMPEDAPFALLMFAGSYECVLFPSTAAARLQFEKALEDTRELLQELKGGKYYPVEPTDDRCSGCHWGKPRLYIPGESETILNGQPIAARTTNVIVGQGEKKRTREFHSHCGDRFGGWVPPHEEALAKGMTKRAE